jgi:hypothetical protein
MNPNLIRSQVDRSRRRSLVDLRATVASHRSGTAHARRPRMDRGGGRACHEAEGGASRDVLAPRAAECRPRAHGLQLRSRWLFQVGHLAQDGQPAIFTFLVALPGMVAWRLTREGIDTLGGFPTNEVIGVGALIIAYILWMALGPSKYSKNAREEFRRRMPKSSARNWPRSIRGRPAMPRRNLVERLKGRERQRPRVQTQMVHIQ